MQITLDCNSASASERALAIMAILQPLTEDARKEVVLEVIDSMDCNMATLDEDVEEWDIDERGN